MKRIIRSFIIDTGALYLVSRIASGMVFEKGYETIALAGVGLMIASLLATPIINILLLPINLITFGTFRWISAVLVLYIVTLVVPGFKILGFFFPGLEAWGVSLPGFALSGLMALVAYSFLLSVISSFIHWLIR